MFYTEGMLGNSQAPWTSRLIPKTWPNAFRNSQVAAIEGFTVPNVCPVCAHKFVYVYLDIHMCVCASKIK